jgi:hypothetical protein
MSIANKEASFSVHVVGETTGETFPGVFRIKLRLSHRDRLREDMLRREYLGPSPEGQSVGIEAATTADILATLNTRIIDAPKWWANTANGLDLEDSNVITTVWNKAMEEILKAMGLEQKSVDQAKTELKTDALASEED